MRQKLSIFLHGLHVFALFLFESWFIVQIFCIFLWSNVETHVVYAICQKLVLRVSLGVPDTEKQMKRPSAFIVSRCLEPLMKHEARVFDMASQTSVRI